MGEAEELHSIAVQLEDWLNHHVKPIHWMEETITELRQLVKELEQEENE